MTGNRGPTVEYTPGDEAIEVGSGSATVELQRVVVEFRPRRLGRRRPVVRAVNGIDLRASRGKTVGIVGESGSGKSTTARTMVRVVRATSGRVLLGGVDVTVVPERKIRPLRKLVQMIFQDPFSSLNPRQPVGRILAEPLRTHGLAAGAEARRRVVEVLDAVGLPPDARARYPHEFSGGQRQRIAIARALMSGPDVVICDEPVSALDVSIQAQVLRLLADLQADLGVGYVFIAHDLAVVASIADEVHVMYAGSVVERGPTSLVLGNPMHPYTAGLVSSIPSVRMKRAGAANPYDISGEPPDPASTHKGCPFASRCWLRHALGDPRECVDTPPPLLAIRGVGAARASACHYVETLDSSAVRDGDVIR